METGLGSFPRGQEIEGETGFPLNPEWGLSQLESMAYKHPVAITVRPYQLFRRNFILVGEPVKVSDSYRANYRTLSQNVMEIIHELKTPKKCFSFESQESLE